jgi:hypothetical protein
MAVLPQHHRLIGVAEPGGDHLQLLTLVEHQVAIVCLKS